VEKDVDLDNIEKAGMYQGRYFVLGGLISVLSAHPKQEIRADKLAERIKLGGENRSLKEVTMALSTNPQADHTMSWLKTFLTPHLETYKLKFSTLGRGLSTGTELEYSDSDTLRSAWQNRG
jgi:recombination protein RecR